MPLRGCSSACRRRFASDALYGQVGFEALVEIAFGYVLLYEIGEVACRRWCIIADRQMKIVCLIRKQSMHRRMMRTLSRLVPGLARMILLRIDKSL